MSCADLIVVSGRMHTGEEGRTRLAVAAAGGALAALQIATKPRKPLAVLTAYLPAESVAADRIRRTVPLAVALMAIQARDCMAFWIGR